MRFKNFQIWRGRLPHWRADDVTYYVTFRHRRALDSNELQTLLHALLQAEGRKLQLLILCCLPEQTEMMFRVSEGPDGRPFELSKVVETAKRKAGKKIVAKSGERFPPFWEESYDRIVRDEAELEERWLSILESPVQAEIVQDPEDYPGLWVRDS